ncbi:MAG: thermonuclease family protein [Magnetococcales bacterium]|nr:thermonuclease family protein [Magnetococcales bacterium]
MVKYQFISLKFLILVAVCSLFASTSHADWTGQVVWIQDGDSLIIKNGKKKRTVRLQGIDSPEKGQPYAQEAKRAAINLAKNRIVRVLVKESDRYGRTVAKVILPDGQNMSHAMVAMGLAWRHIYFAKDPILKTLEAEARKKRLGLWADKNPTPPWVWKRQHRF